MKLIDADHLKKAINEDLILKKLHKSALMNVIDNEPSVEHRFIERWGELLHLLTDYKRVLAKENTEKAETVSDIINEMLHMM